VHILNSSIRFNSNTKYLFCLCGFKSLKQETE
jgi:hypothetical protein